MSKEVGGMVGSRRVKGARSARTEGARRATGVSADGAAVGLGALAPGQRWSASRKRDVVLRLLRGESLDAVSREVGLEVYRLEAWKARALAGMELGQGGLEAGGDTLDDSLLLVGALLGVAVQTHLVGVGRDHLVHVYGLVGPGLERDGGVGVEPAMPFAADDQIPVIVVAQPLHAGFGGDTAVHDYLHEHGREQPPRLPALRDRDQDPRPVTRVCDVT